MLRDQSNDTSKDNNKCSETKATTRAKQRQQQMLRLIGQAYWTAVASALDSARWDEARLRRGTLPGGRYFLYTLMWKQACLNSSSTSTLPSWTSGRR